MRTALRRWPFYVALLTLYVLHNDVWLWNAHSIIVGVPISMLYHIAFCGVTSILFALIVKFAWPTDLEIDEGKDTAL